MTNIKIRLGAAYDDVTFTNPETGQQVRVDRHDIRRNPDPDIRGKLFRELTQAVIDESEVLKDRDKKRFRRQNARKAQERRSSIREAQQDAKG